MKRFQLTFVLWLITYVFAVSVQGQNAAPKFRPPPENSSSSFESGDAPLEASSTRLRLDALSANSITPTDNLSFTSYTGTIEQDLVSRVTIIGSIPIVTGNDNGKTFNEWGNPYAGLSIKLIELQSYHPLWLTIHGGVRFAQPSQDIPVAAPYQEVHTGASLIKHFSGVELITDGNYIQKINDPVPGLKIGNELDAYGGIKVGLGEGWAVQGGYLVRHADPTKQDGQVTIQDDMYTAADFKLSYRIVPSVELVGRFQQPLQPVNAYSKNLGAFGDLTTQASMGQSWSVGLNVGL